MFYNITLVAVKLAEDVFAKAEQQVLVIVCDIALGKPEADYFGLVVDNQM